MPYPPLLFFSSLCTELQDEKDRTSELQASLEEGKAREETLSGDVEAAKEEAQALRDELEASRGETQARTAELETARTRLVEAEGAQGEVGEEVARVKGLLDTARESLDAKTSELNDATANGEKLTTGVRCGGAAPLRGVATGEERLLERGGVEVSEKF